MMIPAKLVPIDDLANQKIKLWLASPESDLLCECLNAEARLAMTELAKDIVAQDVQANEMVSQAIRDRTAEIRRLRDFCSLLTQFRERTTPFSKFQLL